jgi:hypothetical protein
MATELRAERGFWAIGEAIVDAVVTSYPTAFGGQWPTSDLTDLVDMSRAVV